MKKRYLLVILIICLLFTGCGSKTDEEILDDISDQDKETYYETIFMYLKKTYELRNDPTTQMHWFNIKFLTKDAYTKLKNSNAFLVLCSLVMSGVVVEVLKFVIGRMRPKFFDLLGLDGFYPFNTNYWFNSMPSGHTALSFAGLVMLGMLMPRFKWLTWTLASCANGSTTWRSIWTANRGR